MNQITSKEKFKIHLAKVSRIIAESTGNEIEEVAPNALLVDDLGITDTDFARIILRLNKEFYTSIDPEETPEDIETVRELAILVLEEAELG
jgi:acyl carrier protein